MSAFGELAVQCDKRRWRIGLSGSYPHGRHEAGFQISHLEVTASIANDRELLARVPASAETLEESAVAAARALHRQGLIA